MLALRIFDGSIIRGNKTNFGICFLKAVRTIKVTSILKIFPAIFVAVTIVMLSLMVVFTQNERDIRIHQDKAKDLGHQLQVITNYLSSMAESYVIFGDQEYYDAYNQEINVMRNRERIIRELNELDAPENEKVLLSKAKSESEQASLIEQWAFESVRKGNLYEAQAIIFGKDYSEKQERISAELEDFQNTMNLRCQHEVEEAQYYAVVVFIIAITTICGISVILFMLSYSFNKKVRSINTITGIATEIAAGNFSADISGTRSNDEFGKLIISFENMMEILHSIRDQILNIAEGTQRGDFDRRADYKSFSGEWASLLISVNELVDQVIEEQKKTSDLKSRFLVNMSHEIRTPMNAIIGLSQLALMKDQNEENRDTFRKINTSSKNLLSIINDILDFSKIEANKLDLVEDQFNLEEVVSNALFVASERLGDKKVEMSLIMDPGVPYQLFGDKTRVWQVLKNVLDNAAKYTLEGRIILNISTASRSDEKTHVMFSVCDTGMGISEEQQKHLFTPFEQFHNKGVTQNMGTGLGMSITKELVELMDGSIDIQSREGVGTTVTIILGLKNVPVSRSMFEVMSNFEVTAKRVLIVDDDQISCEIMTGLLDLVGVPAACAHSAEEAYEAALRQTESGSPFDVVIMDYMLGDEDGIEVAGKLRNTSCKSSRFLLVSAYIRKLSASAIRDAGFYDQLEKPFVPSLFMQRVSSSLKDDPTESIALCQFPSARVLLCDDNEFNRDVATGMLSAFGILPVVAEHGGEAIELLERHVFDLVLMDLMMPVMDGYEAAKRIRQSGKPYSNIPIIAMTANVMKEDIDRCAAVGMDGHIGKPLDINVVMHQLQKYIPHLEQQAAISAAAPDKPPAVRTAPPAGNGQDEFDYIDVKQGITRCAGKRELFLKLLAKFAGEESGFVPFEIFIKPERQQVSLREVHSLKGVLGNLSIVNMHKATIEFEKTVKDNSFTERDYDDWTGKIIGVKQSILKKIQDGAI